MKTPLVSICCVTYNHAPFIQKAIEGFLMQTTDFPFEILIHDDCSTDGTTEIIKEYEAKYPDLIFPIYEDINQYSNGHKFDIDLFNYSRARGKYIAYCEGDDYWTEPLKLQKQVEFMEAHPEYSVCFHNFLIQHREGDYRIKKYNNENVMNDGGIDVSTNMYFHNSYGGQPLSMLFRKSMYNFQWFNLYSSYKDTHEIYHLLNSGKARYLDFIGGVYRKHSGSATDISETKSCDIERNDILELYLNNKRDKDLASYLLEILLWNYDTFHSNKKNIHSFQRVELSLLREIPLIILKLNIIIIKRLIKHFVKTKRIISFGNGIKRRITRFRLQPIRVFTFHQVSEVFDPDSMWKCDWTNTENFRDKILYLKDQNYLFISLSKAAILIKRNIFRRKKYAVLTADDGWASIKNVIPWLAEQEIPITLFLNPMYFDGIHKQTRSTEQFITKTDIASLVSQYGELITIASHGFSHKDESLMTIEEFETDITKANNILQTFPNIVRFHAFPYGRHTSEQIKYLLSKNIIPVLIDGCKNYNNGKLIHRECIDGKNSMTI